MEKENLLRNKRKFKEQGKLEQLANVCKSLGSLYYLEGNYKDALKQYEEEEQICNSLGLEIRVGVANRMIGEVYGSLENHSLALKHQKIHLEIAKKHNDMIELQRAWATIGRTYFLKADYIAESDKVEYGETLNKAKKAYITSLDICKSLKGISLHEQVEMKARLLLNLGLVIECQGDISSALEHIEQATQLCKNHDVWEDLFRCYNASGGLLFRQNETSRALTQLNLAIATAQRLEQRSTLQVEALRTQAQIHLSLADWAAARKVLKRAYRLRTPIKEDHADIERLLKIVVELCRTQDSLLSTPETNHESRKLLYERMGDGATVVNNYKKSIEYYSKMLENAEMAGDSGIKLAPCYVSLSQTYKDDHQYEPALEYAKKELSLYEDNNPLEACRTLLNIENLEELNGATYAELETTLNQAKNFAEISRDRNLQILVHRAFLSAQRSHSCVDLIHESESMLRSFGIDPDNLSDNESEKLNEDNEDNTQAIGDSVCLETLSDSENEDIDENKNPNLDESESEKPRSRRIAKTFRIRRNEKGETALHTASINGNLSHVHRLLNQGHPVNVRDFCGWTPLHEACNHGFIGIVEALLDSGARIDDRGGEQCDGTTPLHDAASCGNFDVITLLLNRGASPVLKNNNGDTPLDLLVQWRRRVNNKNFSAADDSYYEEIYNRLKTSLNRVGLSMNDHFNENTSENFNSSFTKHDSLSSSNRRETKREIPNKRRLSLIRNQEDLSSSSDEDERNQNKSSEDEDIHFSKSSESSSTKAVEEYQQAITNLRNRKTEPVISKMFTSKRYGLMGENEVGEDWLEDDLQNMQRPSKKRRNTTDSTSLDYIEKQGIRSKIARTKSPSPPISLLHSTNNISEDLSQTYDSYDIESSPPSTNSIISKSNIKIPLKVITRSKPHQTSLFELGFQKENVTNISIPTPVPPTSTHAIKVRVKDKLLLVAVNNPNVMTIGQLAEDASERYYKLEGLKPSLALVTSDGALISDEDPVALILGSEEVIAEVRAWNLAPLHERYADTCKLLNSVIDKTIATCLEASQATQKIDLNELALNEFDLQPILKSITHQSRLLSINLSGNSLGNQGLKILASALPTLNHLESLNLSCNNITAEGISYLSELVTKSTEPFLKAFKHFDLSYNYLGDSSLKYLNTFLKSIHLNDINLAACDIISLDQSPCPFFYLEKLNISNNPLSREAIQGIMNSLDLTKIVSIDFSATNAIREIIARFQRSAPILLETLKIDSCHLTDIDIFDLIKCLNSCSHLATLSICNNPALSSITLRRLLERKPSFISIFVTGCNDILRYLEESEPINWMNSFDEIESRRLKTLHFSTYKAASNQQYQSLIEMWHRTWNEQAKVILGPYGRVQLKVGD